MTSSPHGPAKQQIAKAASFILHEVPSVAQRIERARNEGGDTGSNPVRGTSLERLYSVIMGGAFLNAYTKADEPSLLRVSNRT